VPDTLLAELTSDEAIEQCGGTGGRSDHQPADEQAPRAGGGPEPPSRAVVGFVSAGPATDADRWPGTDGELYELRVEPERTGHGHGGRLLHAVADTLAGDGFHTVSVWALEADSALRGFLGRPAGPPTAPGASSTWARACRCCACTRRSASDRLIEVRAWCA
jgi:ribosomal protein S18 acetylase RimI-like enzyme